MIADVSHNICYKCITIIVCGFIGDNNGYYYTFTIKLEITTEHWTIESLVFREHNVSDIQAHQMTWWSWCGVIYDV